MKNSGMKGGRKNLLGGGFKSKRIFDSRIVKCKHCNDFRVYAVFVNERGQTVLGYDLLRLHFNTEHREALTKIEMFSDFGSLKTEFELLIEAEPMSPNEARKISATQAS